MDPKDVAELIATTFSEMIFVFGEVHCDPHAANLLIRSKVLLLFHETHHKLFNSHSHVASDFIVEEVIPYSFEICVACRIAA